MKTEEYASLLDSRFKRYFDMLPDNVWDGTSYDAAALYEATENHTALFKENVMDYIETKEICLVSFNADPAFIQTELEALPGIAVRSAKPSIHHKSTTVLRVFAAESVSKEAVRMVRRFRFSKPFRFYLFGYAECKTVLADLSTGKVYTNFAGRLEKKIFAPGVSGS